jgi:hypothetical protein
MYLAAAFTVKDRLPVIHLSEGSVRAAQRAKEQAVNIFDDPKLAHLVRDLPLSISGG